MLVADREGAVVAFALGNLQERAQMFVAPGDLVYEGMIAGENSRPGDLDVNVTKEKKLTNMRDHGDPTTTSSWSRRAQITLEYALEYIEEDELIEVTPQDDPAAQAGPAGERSQEGCPGRRPGGGRVVTQRLSPSSRMAEAIMPARETSYGALRCGGSSTIDEFEDDGFSFDDDDDDEKDDDEDEDEDDDLESLDDEDIEEFDDFDEDEDR